MTHFVTFVTKIEYMIKIADVVRDITSSSEIALSGLHVGHLNLSAYAKSIHKEVEERTKKPVRIGSIVIALSRFRKTLTYDNSPFFPKIVIEDLSVKSGLVEVAFDKTQTNLGKLKLLYKDKKFGAGEFFMVTHGTGEISIITLQKAEDHVLKTYHPQKPKAIYRDLVGITIRFDKRYIEIPNVIYTFIRTLALKKINIIEVVSTYTEITFLVRQKDLEKTFILLNSFFENRKSQR